MPRLSSNTCFCTDRDRPKVPRNRIKHRPKFSNSLNIWLKAEQGVTSGRVETGTYTFTLDGRLIGTNITGRFESELAGKVVKSGRFVGGIDTP